MIVGALVVCLGYVLMGGPLEGSGDIIVAYYKDPIGWLIIGGLCCVGLGLFFVVRKSTPRMPPDVRQVIEQNTVESETR